MKITKHTERTDDPIPSAGLISPKMKIKEIKDNTMMWPAVILAKSRTISTKGFVIIPISSTKGIKGTGYFNHQGTPGVLKICFQ